MRVGEGYQENLGKQDAFQGLSGLRREALWRRLPALPSVGKRSFGLAEVLERRKEMKLRGETVLTHSSVR